ncbi:Holliday junction branch migration DNA helicase RuvB [Oligoflexaceae bacterium]|nr:Holliday junction branch migration DNA helicase RuvB [Oligoflexaceae bacterium]
MTQAPDSVKIERLVDSKPIEIDNSYTQLETGIRPERFDDYPGQVRAKENLQVYVKAAKNRQQAMDHVLLHGPPGLGKTTLARIIANELEVPFFQTSGPSIDKAGDLAGILAGLEKNAVLFIDEIHRLSTAVEEVLYSAMEDYCMDIIVGQGPAARTVRMPLQPFTLIGATTRLSLLSRPLVSRFGIQERMEFYDERSLAEILKRSAEIQSFSLSSEGALALAQRSRGTPRTANRLLRRVWDFTEVEGEQQISPSRVDGALQSMEIDKLGLEPIDRNILKTIEERYAGGPVGLDTLAHTVGEDKTTLEDVYEPFLVFSGLIVRGSRGREITDLGRDHIIKD